jgi:glutamate dehydrogenase
MALYKRLIASDVPEDNYLRGELERYFPPQLTEHYGKLFAKHRLRREIVATATTNSMVNRMGPSFVLRVQEDTGANVGQIARAYAIAREAFDMRELWLQVEALDAKTPSAVQYTVFNESTRLLRFATYWLLRRYGSRLDIESHVATLRPGLRQLRSALPPLLRGVAKAHFDKSRKQTSARLPDAIATRVALFDALTSGPDIVDVAAESKVTIGNVATLYFALGDELGLDWLRTQIASLRVDGRWQAIARATLRDQLYALQRALCRQVLATKAKQPPTAALASWLDRRSDALGFVKQTLADMRSLPTADFATLSVALQSLRKLAEQA